MKRLTVFIHAASSGDTALTADKRAIPAKQSVAPMHQASVVTVGEAGEGQRLDNFLLRHCRGVPKTHIYRLIRSGQVRVNGGRAKAATRLSPTDSVRIPPIRLATPANGKPSAGQQRSRARQGDALPILYEDEAILAINKPAGVAVHGGSGVSSGVIEQLRAARPNARFLELVHRLDRETSGVLLVARRRAALANLHAQIREQTTTKVYLAVLAGRVPRRDRTLRDPLRRYLTGDGERRVVIDPAEGKPATSHLRGLHHAEVQGAGTLTLTRVQIETGRTHQIRVHSAGYGHPVVGDRKYGDFDLNREVARAGVSRMLLHARQLGLRHPITHQPLTITAPLPAEFLALFPDATIPGDPDSDESASN